MCDGRRVNGHNGHRKSPSLQVRALLVAADDRETSGRVMRLSCLKPGLLWQDDYRIE